MKNIFRFLCLTLVAGLTFASCSKDDDNSTNADGKYTITVVSADEAMGKAYGGGQFAPNTTTRIWGTPEVGYQFDKWSDGNTENPRTITVTGNATYTAVFKTVGGDNPNPNPNPNPGGGETPGNFSASFTVNGTSYQGIALVSLGTMEGLFNLTIYAGEQGPVFASFIQPQTGTQSLADGIQAYFYTDENSFVTTANNGDMPPYITVAGMSTMDVTVNTLDLNTGEVEISMSGTMLDIAAAEAGNPTTVPFTASMSGFYQTGSTPTPSR